MLCLTALLVILLTIFIIIGVMIALIAIGAPIIIDIVLAIGLISLDVKIAKKLFRRK